MRLFPENDKKNFEFSAMFIPRSGIYEPLWCVQSRQHGSVVFCFIIWSASVFIDAVDMCKVYWKIDAFAVMNRK